MKFSLSDLADSLNGRLHVPRGAERNLEADGVSIDSRGEMANRLFVPLVAARDGHDFISSALDAGAAAYLTEREPLADRATPAIQVSDTTVALSALGSAARQRMAGPVVGITGSVGKTSVKDLALAACSAGGPAYASVASFNNEIGVPLTLANGPASDSGVAEALPVVIAEMGARGIGHIAQLCGIAQPTVGVVTRVALVHSELFGSIEAVAKAKGELIESLPSDGTAVLNADDPLVSAMASRSAARVIRYGVDASAEMRRSPVELDSELRPRFTVMSPWGSAEVHLAVRGAHMADNALAALSVAVAAGVSFDAAAQGVQSGGLSDWRMELSVTQSGATVINDAYNANPTSMRAGLRALYDCEAERRTAVLGAMGELGPEGPPEHRNIAAEAVAAGVRVIAVDAVEYGAEAIHVADVAGAVEALGLIGSGDAVLIKGSRAAGLERLAAALNKT